MKKIITVMMVLFMGFMLVSCDKSKEAANISNPDEAYITFNYNNKTITITKGELYQKLKLSYGTDSAINVIDTATMKNTKNDSGTSYWDLITDEEIETELNEEIEETMEDDQTFAEAKESYLETIQQSGYNTYDEYEDIIHLELSKKAYAKDQLIKEIAEQDEAYAKYLEDYEKATAEEKEEMEEVTPYYTESQYTTRYESLYSNKYFGIVLSFNTIKHAREALLQIGVESVNNQLVWISTQTPLTTNEIVKAYIDMYNNQNSSYAEGYPLNRLPLTEDVQYTVESEKISFSTEIAEEGSDNEKAKNRLSYTLAEINSINSSFRAYFVDTMEAYDPQTSTTTGNWYTPNYRTYSNGALYVYALKIATIEPTPFEDVEDEIYQSLLENTLTSSYISNKMGALRAETNLVIYDPYCEDLYAANYSSYEETSESSTTLIMKNDYAEVTADQLYVALEKAFGKIYGADMAFQAMILRSEYNTIYNVETQEVLDANAWGAIATQFSSAEKTYNDNYAAYATWEDYIFYTYGVYTNDQLKMYFLYESVLSNYGSQLGQLSEDTAETWLRYKEQMDKRVNDYFSLDYLQLVISAVDEDGTTLDFEDWSDYQKELGKAIVDSIWAIDFDTYKGGVEKFFTDLVNAYKVAPALSINGSVNLENGVVNCEPNATPNSDVLSYTFNGVAVSAAKSAGLTFEYETEATFTNSSSYVDEFLELGKILWDDLDHIAYDDDKYYLTSFIKDEVEERYLTTTYGYHVYVNTGINELSTYKITSSTNDFLSGEILINEEYVLPSLDMILQYLADASDGDLLSAIKTSITTYFIPLYNELSGTAYAQKEALKSFSQINFNLNNTSYTAEDFKKAITRQITSTNDSLTYFKEDIK